jgi:hypothetical protein
MKRILHLIALLLFALVSTGSANAMTYSGLIKVQLCKPALNESTFYGGGVPAYGWAPGYYPSGPYYWSNVYGNRYYQPPVTTTAPELGIDYTNVTHKTMKEIEFGLVANRNLVAEVKDVGTFSPGVEIKHKFGISQNVFPLQTALAECVPLKVRFADGTKWKSPHLPALKHRLGE